MLVFVFARILTHLRLCNRREMRFACHLRSALPCASLRLPEHHHEEHRVAITRFEHERIAKLASDG